MVRPKVGAAEGRVGGGSGGRPPGKFCKKDTKSCVLGVTSGEGVVKYTTPCFWHTSGAECSRVEYSTQYDCRCITDLRVRV